MATYFERLKSVVFGTRKLKKNIVNQQKKMQGLSYEEILSTYNNYIGDLYDYKLLDNFTLFTKADFYQLLSLYKLAICRYCFKKLANDTKQICVECAKFDPIFCYCGHYSRISNVKYTTDYMHYRPICKECNPEPPLEPLLFYSDLVEIIKYNTGYRIKKCVKCDDRYAQLVSCAYNNITKYEYECNMTIKNKQDRKKEFSQMCFNCQKDAIEPLLEPNF